ncbi:PX domain-containing protein [Phyllosticta paracitricarpa]|uniref:Endosomal/vacuolar adapter protein YPT35 n=1 Tax=Phyllosticta paracitricarpa TaxID=2016321 RepID=A0ABR1N409_9PEZI
MDDTTPNGRGSTPTPDAAQHQDIVPPYWHSRNRTASVESHASSGQHRPAPIRLEDHTVENSDQSRALWARSVSIDDYVIASGNVPGMGDYVVWNCTVQTLNGGPMKIRKRYSEFDDLRQRLARTFPHAEAALPELPPKSFVSRFRPRFLERRKAGLSYFLNLLMSRSCVLLNPEFSASPVLKDFLFS